MKSPEGNKRDIELFIETYGRNLSESEQAEILKDYSNYVETEGKDIVDVKHNLDNAAKRKFGFRFWIRKNSAYIVLLPFLLLLIIGILVLKFSQQVNIVTVLILVAPTIIINKILRKAVDKTIKDVDRYKYYIRQVALRKLRKRRKQS